LDKLTREQFIRYLRDGLNNLQDPTFLRACPLVEIFHLSKRYDTPYELQRILVEAIQSLEPKPDEPANSRAWRMYESLYYRYVEHYDQEEVASQLGMSARQVRREQKAALEALSLKLWEQYHPGEEAVPKQAEISPGRVGEIIAEEVGWIKDVPLENPAELNLLLPNLVDLLLPLCSQYHVQMVVHPLKNNVKVAVDAVVMKQALINLLEITIPRAAARGRLSLSIQVKAWQVLCKVHCQAEGQGAVPLTSAEQARFEVVQYLVQPYGGKTAVLPGSAEFSLSIAVPGLEQLLVMVIDDNEGTFQLFQRYAAGTRYRLVGCQNPANAMAMIEKSSPQMIILDVMMPRIDGWEILSKLRGQEATLNIPVIVCTILAQEELAISLGAKGFLQKPATRQDFLAALDSLAAQMDSALR